MPPVSRPSVTVATSPSRVRSPMMRFSNSSGVVTDGGGAHDDVLVVGGQRAGRHVEGDIDASALRDVGDGQAEAGQLGLVDVDAEDLVAVAIDLHVGDAGHGGQRVDDLRPRPGSVMSSTDIVSEVTASRITASALASALTMRGASASSGSWLAIRGRRRRACRRPRRRGRRRR